MSALHAAFNSPDQPLAYAVFGGESRTAALLDTTGLMMFAKISAATSASMGQLT